MGKLLLAFVAFFLAAWLSPVLTDTFFASVAGSVATVGSALFPENLGDLPLSSWFVLLLWTAILWVVLRYIGVPFGFIRPRAERLSDTKPMRYFQGFFGEGFIFFACMFAGLIIAALISPIVAEENKASTIKSINNEIAEINQEYSAYVNSFRYAPIKKNIQEQWQKRVVNMKNTKFSFPYDEKSLTDTFEFIGNNCLDQEQLKKREHNIIGMCLWAIYAIDEISEKTDFVDRMKTAEDKRSAVNKSFEDVSFLQRIYFGIDYLGWFPIALASFFIFAFVRGYLQERGPIETYQKFVEFLDQSRLGFGGAGRFTGLFEEWGFSYTSTKALFLGRSLFNPFLKIGIQDDRHMLTIAGSRGGKGTCVIIPNLLKWSGSVVVIDPKGTNAAVTAEARRKMGQNVYVIDPFDITSEPKSSFDPLAMLDPESPLIREKINLIADALVVRDANTKDPHWDDGARSILAGLIGHMVTEGTARTLPDLRTFITMPPDKKTDLWVDMMMNNGAGGLPIDAANRVMGGADTPEIKGILSNADKHTEWLSSPVMRNALNRSSFKFQALKDKPTTIYLVIPMQYLETHNRFIRLFINLVIREFVEGGRAKVPTLLMIDEFLSLGYMAEVERAMSWTAGYNLFLWPFVQDFGTLKQLYGSKVNAFISNSRAVQVFAVDDEETNKFVSGRLGERPLANRLDITRSNEVMPLRKPSEVPLDIAAESGRQYIMRTGKPAMLLERVAYYNSWMFKGKFSPDPDYPKTELKPWELKI